MHADKLLSTAQWTMLLLVENHCPRQFLNPSISNGIDNRETWFKTRVMLDKPEVSAANMARVSGYAAHHQASSPTADINALHTLRHRLQTRANESDIATPC